uniref:glycosyltransferase family 2 protein n=1 Tax=Candidatus Onthocola sp. TaxID=3085646 RepID=UPI003FF01A8C
MKIKFSIIVPVYNVEKYLNTCLESIVKQTYNNYEVIIVCDKCDDNSEMIVDYYVKKYNWKKIHEEYTGLSKARNLGVDEAKGDYLMFLDGDDYLDDHLLETINNLLDDDTDILRFQVQDVNDKNIVQHKEDGFRIMKGTEAFNKIIRYHYIENAWAYTYKTSFWKKNNFKFMDGCLAEDYGLTPLVIAKADKIKSISYIGYNYVQRSNSLMTNDDYSKKIKKMDDMLKQSNYEINELKKIDNSEKIIGFLNNSLIYYSTTLKYKDYKKYNKILKNNKCFKHLKGKGIKSFLKYLLIKGNSYFFYKFIVR